MRAEKNVFVSTKTSFLLSCKNMLARLTALKNLLGIPQTPWCERYNQRSTALRCNIERCLQKYGLPSEITLKYKRGKNIPERNNDV